MKTEIDKIKWWAAWGFSRAYVARKLEIPESTFRRWIRDIDLDKLFSDKPKRRPVHG